MCVLVGHQCFSWHIELLLRRQITERKDLSKRHLCVIFYFVSTVI